MSDARTISGALLIAGIVISAISFGYYLVNIDPMYAYISDTVDCLERAEEETTFERQLYAVNESIKIYETGISQQHLQALRTLATLDSKEKMDYWLPKIISQLEREGEGARFPLRGLVTAGLLFVFMVTNGWGTFGDYNSWSTDERHFYIALDSGLLLAIIVAFIP